MVLKYGFSIAQKKVAPESPAPLLLKTE